MSSNEQTADLSRREDNRPSPWMRLENTNKILTFLVYVGSIFSAVSTTLIIYVYCNNNGILFLMPLVFKEISFNTFLLFFIPVLSVIAFPIYFGVWGGNLSLEIKKNPEFNYLIGEINPSSNVFGFWDVVIAIGCFLMLLSPFFFLLKSIYLIILFVFLVVFVFNYLILFKFLYKKKNIKKNNFSTLYSAFFPTIGGIVFSIPYYLVFKDLFRLPLTSGLVLFTLILPILLSSLVFLLILFVERGIFLVLLIILILFLFGFPQLLLKSSISNSYFQKMKYGSILVSIITPPDMYEKSPKISYVGKILFNSGSDLYVTLNQKQNDTSSLNKIYLKHGVGVFPKKIRSNQIIRISYKDMESIPQF